VSDDHGSHYHPEPEPDTHSPDRDAFGPTPGRGARSGADGGGEVRRLAQPVVATLGAVLRHLHWPLLGLTLLYFASGITFVGEGERALVLRFGKLVGASPAEQVHEPGLLLAWPAPIDRVLRVPVERISQVEVDALDMSDQRWEEMDLIWRQMLANPEDAPEFPESIDPQSEGYLLTGDRGIVQTRFMVRYRVGDPVAFALREANPEALITAAVQSAAVEVAAALDMDALLGDERSRFVSFVERRAQALLQELNGGLRIESLELGPLAPPLAIAPASAEVQQAQTEARTKRQEAEAYRRSEIARASGEAAKLRNEATGYALDQVADAKAFAEFLDSFKNLEGEQRDVTLARLQEEAFRRALERVGSNLSLFSPAAGDSYGDFRVTLSGDDLGGSSSE
jgi:membrane protease subunit HflK